MNQMKFWNTLLFLGIIVSGITYVAVSRNFMFIYAVFIPTLLASLFSLFLLKKLMINTRFELYVNLALWANLLGEYYFYYHSVYYDKFLHFIIPLFIAVIIYEYFSKNSNGNPKKSLVFFTVLGIGAAFEIFEYFQSNIFHFPSVGVYNNSELVMPMYPDTIWDLVMNSLGTLSYLIFKKANIEK